MLRLAFCSVRPPHRSFISLIILLCLFIAFIYFMYHSELTNPRLLDLEPLVVPELGTNGQPASLLMTQNDWTDYERQYFKYYYNGWLSERISLKRHLNDQRQLGCPADSSYGELPSVSVIIGFHREQPHTLLRTIHSIHERTKPQLLREIILVNDGGAAEAGTPLDQDAQTAAWQEYILDKFKKVRLLHTPGERGIVAARLLGAQAATAEVLVFLDAHVEVTFGWLPPLLAPIARSKYTVTQPAIDKIEPDSFAYKQQPLRRLGFTWQLGDVWLPLSNQMQHQLPSPYEMPLLIGPAFAMARQLFWQLGGYDEQMSCVDGERLELSLKIWLCGSRLLLVPCSRVGHVEKNDYGRAHAPAGRDRSESARRNFKRVVEVWFDDFKRYVYRDSPVLLDVAAGNLSQARTLRRRLKCRKFKWFLEQVAPDFQKHWLTASWPNFGAGSIHPFALPSHCLDNTVHPVGVAKCVEHSEATQQWMLTQRCELRIGKQCLSVNNEQLSMERCNEDILSSHWYYNYLRRAFVRNGTHCLQVDMKNSRVFLNTCIEYEKHQHWFFNGIVDNRWEDLMQHCLHK